MDVKKESKLILTALTLAPIGGGIVLVIQGEGAAYGWLLIILSLIFLVWLWQPWKWFQEKDEHGHSHK
jgi:hypothetical protein